MSFGIEQDLDVLIVGGGPAGTMLALELAAQKDVKFCIIDKATQRSDKSRALIVQPRSFELMNRHGEARELYEKGNVTSGPIAWVNGQPLIDIDLKKVANYKDSQFGLPSLLSQVDTEAYLDKCLREGCQQEIKYGFEAVSVVQDDDGVDVVLRNVDTGLEEKIRTRYIVGADGARSIVRKSSTNIKFEGDTYPQEFLLCDATITNLHPLDQDRYHLILDSGLLAIFPMTGGWTRVMASKPGSGTPPTLDYVESVLRRKYTDCEISNVTWLNNFKLHHRVASSYRDGRLLLIGDAAHIHSPVGGQGLNTSLLDAVNLGWKLASVIRGDRQEHLLNTFNEERHQVGEDLLAKTDMVFRFVSTTSLLAKLARDYILPWVAGYINADTNLQSIYKFASQFGINYRESSIVHRGNGFKGPVVAGDRAPDGDVDVDGKTMRLHKLLTPGSFHFVLFSGSCRNGTEQKEMDDALARFEEKNPDRARVHMIVQERGAKHPYSHRLHATYGLSRPGYVYTRPDGYVASIGNLEHIDDFLRWLD